MTDRPAIEPGTWPAADASEEVSPAQLAFRLGRGSAAVRLIDCREDDEFAFNRIDGARHLPLSRWPQLGPSLLETGAAGAGEESPPVVVYCHHGVRSLQAVRWLRARGLAACFSLAGGIESWSIEVDSNVPRY